MEPRENRWLITGGAGFIGSNLAADLLRAGTPVTVLDDLSSGQVRNIDRLREYGDLFRFVRASILDREGTASALEEVNVLVNLAAQVSVARSMARPDETLMINDRGFRTVSTLALEVGVRRIVFASSAAVYGDNPVLPLTEQSERRPQSPYAQSKVANETAAAELADRYPDLSVTGLRFFNVYGPNQTVSSGYAAVIPAWLAAQERSVPPVIFGDGRQTRDFCYVSDVVAIIRAIVRGARLGASVYNVGCGTSVTLLELLETINKLVRGVGSVLPPPVFEEQRPGDIRHSSCDIATPMRDIGWRPQVSLEEGLWTLITDRVGR
jgi:nucleoside-diphosphate-sugar epimerase